MKKKFLHFQPEYVRKFICDGAACNAHCCRNSWLITIDKKIYQKYSRLKSNDTVKKFMQHLKFDPSLDFYVLDTSEIHCCPVLGEDNLCELQKNYGLDFLSETCQTYPRNIYKIAGAYEWSLTVSCPLVAKLALMPEEPMVFEQIDLFPPLDTNIKARSHRVPTNLIEYVFPIQFAAISILQERKLSIDSRLAVLGFFMDQLEDICEGGQVEKISALVEVYTSENFLEQNVPTILASVEFNPSDFVKILFGVLLGNVYGGVSTHKKFLGALTKILKINLNSDGSVRLGEVVKNFLALDEIYQNFVRRFSSVFENYLVNEFFTSLYPFNAEGSIRLNFNVFLASYKIVELFSFAAIYSSDENFSDADKEKLVEIISELAETTDHSEIYLERIAQSLRDKNIFEIMKSFLQVQGGINFEL